jgi:valyl-tRNA synthetase
LRSTVLTPPSFAVIFHARNPALAQTLRDAENALRVLIKGCDSFTIVENESEIPVGCVGENVSPDLAAHLLLKVRLISSRLVSFSPLFPARLWLISNAQTREQGVVNVGVEIAKAEKKKAFQQAAADKLREGMKAPGYETKKPLNVREKDAVKVRCCLMLDLTPDWDAC